MHTVVETPPYLRCAEGLFNDEGREAVVDLVARDPECGELMPGTGGFRKVRIARSGMGKRGGARVIYIVTKRYARIPDCRLCEEREGKPYEG